MDCNELKQGETMDREKMIDTIVEDMEDWLERDAYSFWDHIRDLERDYLKAKDDKELAEIHEESV